MLNKFIKFSDKRQCRLWLKLAYGTSGYYHISSIYVVDQSFYLLITPKPLCIIAKSEFAVVDLRLENLNAAEQLILQWGSAELNSVIEFVKLETQSTLVSNGRELRVGHSRVTRTFICLTDTMAIINFTPDSFSDRGCYNQIDTACERIVEQLELGAQIIDVGAEATNPLAPGPLTSLDEIKRLQLILPEVLSLKSQYKFLLSIDTYHNETVKWLANFDIDIVNDVSGMLDLHLVKQFTNVDRHYIAMHSLAIPADKSKIIDLNSNPIEVLLTWMRTKLQQMQDFGIDTSHVIFDPGIGFGNNPGQAWAILRRLKCLRQLGTEILLGHSRKSFLNHISDSNGENAKHDVETALIAANLAHQVDYLRLHDLTLFKRMYSVVNNL